MNSMIVAIIAVIGAIALTLFVFEIGSTFQYAVSLGKHSRMAGVYTASASIPRRRPTWEALIANILPGRFDPTRAANLGSVIEQLRRAGWPYETPGDYYAAAIRTFAVYLLIGAGCAVGVALSDAPEMAPFVAAAFVYLGLRRPGYQLQQKVKRRAEAMRSNMLIGLSVLNSLLDAGVGVQEALRRTASVGGPFCNLLGLLVAQMDRQSLPKAFAVTQAHLPDPDDVEMSMFLRDVEAYFTTNRPLGAGVHALQAAVHRLVVERTTERASLVQRRAGLFGVLAVVGLLLGLIMPYSGNGLF